MADTTATQMLPQEAEATTCCEPECGPDTCESSAVAVEVPLTMKQVAAVQCCEPECGPDTLALAKLEGALAGSKPAALSTGCGGCGNWAAPSRTGAWGG